MKTLLRISLFMALFQAASCFAAPVSIQVTIGASATQISATNLYCSAWIIQNNAGHNIRFGASNVTSSFGTLLASGAPGGSYTSTGQMDGSQPVPDNLAQWYIAGTQNDVIDVTCKQVNF
jgi:hypothetical protein